MGTVLLILMWIAGIMVGAGVGIPLGKWLKTNEESEKKIKEFSEKFDNL